MNTVWRIGACQPRVPRQTAKTLHIVKHIWSSAYRHVLTSYKTTALSRPSPNALDAPSTDIMFVLTHDGHNPPRCVWCAPTNFCRGERSYRGTPDRAKHTQAIHMREVAQTMSFSALPGGVFPPYSGHIRWTLWCVKQLCAMQESPRIKGMWRPRHLTCSKGPLAPQQLRDSAQSHLHDSRRNVVHINPAMHKSC